jgi:hypothetical protein
MKLYDGVGHEAFVSIKNVDGTALAAKSAPSNGPILVRPGEVVDVDIQAIAPVSRRRSVGDRE